MSVFVEKGTFLMKILIIGSAIENSDNAKFVVKIEPKENGSLYTEQHFYLNCCKEAKSKKI